MQGQKSEHQSESSCNLEVKVAFPFLVTFWKTRWVTPDGRNGVEGTDSVREAAWWWVHRSSVCMAASRREHFVKQEGDMKM